MLLRDGWISRLLSWMSWQKWNHISEDKFLGNFANQLRIINHILRFESLLSSSSVWLIWLTACRTSTRTILQQSCSLMRSWKRSTHLDHHLLEQDRLEMIRILHAARVESGNGKKLNLALLLNQVGEYSNLSRRPRTKTVLCKQRYQPKFASLTMRTGEQLCKTAQYQRRIVT
jgi:hypothetical protein